MSKKSDLQYQQNIDIIKGFFRKPIVLIVGIFTIVASIVNSVAEYISAFDFTDILNSFSGSDIRSSFNIGGKAVYFSFKSDAPDIFSLDFLTIALGLSFILLFAFGRSKGNAIQGGVTFFKVMSHIYYVLYFIIAVAAVLMVIFTFAFSVDNITKLILIVSFLVIGLFVFLLGYSQLQFAKSAKESMNSIYLSNSGAKLHGIIRIIGAVAVSAVSAVALCFILSLGGFNSPLAVVGSVASAVLLIVNNILWAVVALKYHSYINGVTSGKIELSVDVVKEEKEMICSNCGNTLTDEDVFCAVCGNKVQ